MRKNLATLAQMKEQINADIAVNTAGKLANSVGHSMNYIRSMINRNPELLGMLSENHKRSRAKYLHDFITNVNSLKTPANTLMECCEMAGVNYHTYSKHRREFRNQGYERYFNEDDNTNN